MCASALDEVLAGKPVSRHFDPALRLLAEIPAHLHLIAEPCRTTAGIRTIMTITTMARHDHSRPTRRLVLAAATFLPFGGASAQTVDAAQRIAEQANRFLALLDDGQRRQVLIAFESDNRLDWHYIPRSRSGLTLGEMKPAQADAARALFAAVLNEQGLRLLEACASSKACCANSRAASAIPAAITSRSSARPAVSRGAGASRAITCR